MPSDYDQIRLRNIKRYGEDEDYHSMLVDDLYSDRTHFIYEILQNAEDAGASKVRFVVSQDKLEVMHDGSPFTTQDVKGVCGIGKGQKAADLTKIGRFGIGFKSVYAYTTSPEIHSGDEHFRIKKYVRPYRAKARRVDGSCTTLFVFPFDKDEPDQKTALREISNRLSKLTARPLLFLKEIKEIEYRSHEMSGLYLRRESRQGSARKLELIGQKEKETWMVFKRAVRAPNGNQVFVELGYRMNRKMKTIKREHNTPLVVYFQTKEPTGLGFLIQGPYRTNLARNHIPSSNHWNRKLIEETAKLAVDSLRQLKAMGLLTVSLLETLPIVADDFPSEHMFHSIFDRVKSALRNEELLPADDGSFVAARSAKLARGVDLTKLLNRSQLRRLFVSNDDVHWLRSDITESRTPELRRYLIDEIEVEEVTPGTFAERVDHGFLEEQSDEWVSEFYCFLSDQGALWRPRSQRTDWQAEKSEGILRGKEILRLQDGAHVRPFNDSDEPNAYLSPPDEAEAHPGHRRTGTSRHAEGSLRIVKAALTRRDDAANFLKELGIRRFDIVDDVIKHVLPKYRSDADSPSYAENQRDLERIRRAYDADSSESRLKVLLSETPFIFCTVAATGRKEYRTADKVYFRSDDLCNYFEGHTSFAYIDPPEDQRALYERLGVEWSVRIQRTSQTQGGYVIYRSNWGDHRRGRDGFDQYISVDGLKQALDKPTIEKSAFIWKEIAIPNFRCIRGTVESSGRQNYLNSDTKEVVSSFGSLLIDEAWLPDTTGKMHRPGDLSVDDLHSEFERSGTEVDQLAVKLGMVGPESEVLEKMGVSPQGWELARQYDKMTPDVQRQVAAIMTQARGRPDFPTGEEVKDPERRRTRVQGEYERASPKTYEQQPRSIRSTRNAIDPDTQLRQWYTNESDQMVCQICKRVMPFKKRDGEYYFVRVEVLKDQLPNEYASQFVALCPLCAAKYKYFVKGDHEAMDGLRRALIDMDVRIRTELEAPLTFGEESATLRFVTRHIVDLRAILELVAGTYRDCH